MSDGDGGVAKTQYWTATSLDGYLADEQNSLDWLLRLDEPPSMRDAYPRFIERVGAVAMGSTTYEWVVEHEQMLEHPERWPYQMPAWVFSSRALPAIAHADIRFVRGDVAPIHAEMKEAAAGKNIWLMGGGDLVGQFYDRGLLDEIVLAVAPVTLGSGAPLLPRNITSPPLKLVGVEQHGDVFAVLRYEVRVTR